MTNSDFHDAIVNSFISAAQDSLLLGNLVQLASVQDIPAVDNLYRSNVTDESKNIETIDGIIVSAGMNVLIKDQNDSSQNGIYTCIQTTAGCQLENLNQSIYTGLAFVVENGATNALKTFV